MTAGEGRPTLWIAGGCRTPFVRAFGRAAESSAVDLARFVVGESVRRLDVEPEALDEVVVGCAGQPVDAMNLGRVAALRAGVPASVPAFTVHRNCASGIEAVGQALWRVRSGRRGIWVCAGAESMSQAPFQVPREGALMLVRLAQAKGVRRKARALLALRPRALLPRPTLRTALTDPVSGMLMGDTAELLAREWDIPREEQDRFAAESQRRAARARKEGIFDEEIAPYPAAPRFRQVLDGDDGIREDATPERLARLRPVFDRRFGTITVGNACQITDGAAALVCADEATLRERGLEPLSEVVDRVTVGCDPRRMGLGPALAIPPLLERNGLTVDEVGRFEINEAFAAQVLAVLRCMGDDAPDIDRLNVNGGAIALGHPVGATGVRLILTLALEMRRSGTRYGVAALCVGGGQGDAVLLRNPAA